MHDCNNDVCQLLNPCLKELLSYGEVLNRLHRVEKYFRDYMEGSIPSYLRHKRPIDFFGWANQHFVFQVPNLEFVQELAKEIDKIDPSVALEVGAGRGIISRHISKMEKRPIILTDDYSWWNNKDDEKIDHPDIIKISYGRAIKRYGPDLIIASWIPYKRNWTEIFRRYPYVKGYILIGEESGGCTGCENDWDTDWKIKRLSNVEKFGICRTDHRDFFHTNVTYFERP